MKRFNKRRLIFVHAMLLAVGAYFVGGAFAKEDRIDQTWVDPATATEEDPDFSIQGEYGVDDVGQEWGLQVVALGDGEFDAYLLKGGLPGLGWESSMPRLKLSGVREDDVVRLASEDGESTAVIQNGRSAVHVADELVADLPRVHRKSPTLGAEPPEGAIVLFDGTNADAWIDGTVEDGLLPNNDLTSKRTFGDYKLHLEFRTPYKPFARGQRRGNSGVYHQGRYETQVLDSFGLEPAMNHAGGIYSIAAPRLNMCLPPLTWQTYDVDFTAACFDDSGKLIENARMTVCLNGVMIHDDQELRAKSTTAAPVKKIGPEQGPIYLQRHNNPVYYRNIWIVPK